MIVVRAVGCVSGVRWRGEEVGGRGVDSVTQVRVVGRLKCGARMLRPFELVNDCDLLLFLQRAHRGSYSSGCPGQCDTLDFKAREVQVRLADKFEQARPATSLHQHLGSPKHDLQQKQVLHLCEFRIL